MQHVELNALPDFLTQQRWFAGKAEPIKSVSVVDHVPLGDRGDLLAVVEVQYGLAPPESYLLPVRRTRTGTLIDALEKPELPIELLRIIREEKKVPSTAGAIYGERISREPVWEALPDSVEVRAVAAEQSNSSVVFGNAAILKVIRKLEAGSSPELELGRFLASRTDFHAAPRLLGALHLEGPAASTLALLHTYIPDAKDAWKSTLEALGHGPPGPALTGSMRALGETIARLHVALGSDEADPAFAPEPLLQEDLQRWSASIMGELSVTTQLAQRQFPELADRREPLLAKAHALTEVAASGMKIRLHGDLHLGQVLHTESGWRVIDFEGEPVRSATARREKHSPLKDVAGMLRSFAYAVAVAALPPEEKPAAVHALREAFLAGYRSVPGIAKLLPTSEETRRILLEALELDKVLYETRYELQMRPDWVHIPVESLLAQTQAPTEP